jgi:hypothetical protein
MESDSFYTGFPETIDKLEPEIGETGGPKPIVFGAFVLGPLSLSTDTYLA